MRCIQTGVPELGHPNGYGWREDDGGWWLATGEDARTPPKTIYPPNWLGSLDAAISLVPEGWSVQIIRTADSQYGNANLYWFHDGNNIPAKKMHGAAATPALALVAACLKARAQ